MEVMPRHQCLIYDGSPARMLPLIASQIAQRLSKNFRCLYLNSPPMVAGIRSYLYATGIDVEDCVAGGSLILSAEASPLKNGHFDMERMLESLEQILITASDEGYAGLWASGDMSWEMGPDKNLRRLLEYEWGLEQLFQKYPGFSGICQYHAETLPQDMLCHGILVHPALFINDTLSRTNPNYTATDRPIHPMVPSTELKLTVKNICSLQLGNGNDLP
jgi:hypothetical protein